LLSGKNKKLPLKLLSLKPNQEAQAPKKLNILGTISETLKTKRKKNSDITKLKDLLHSFLK